jgi:hypothetical protein
MRHIILYAKDCAACSKVARMIREASIPGLEARGLTEPEVTQWLSTAGLSTPNRPSLLVVDDADGVELLHGLSMRRRLATVVGWRRSGTIVGLLGAEWRARIEKAGAPRIPSRRGLIGGLVAGVTGGLVMATGMAEAAPPAAPGLTMADPADAARVMKTEAARRAIRTWGAAEPVHEIRGGENPVFVLVHPDRDIYTFIDNTPGALSSGSPAVLSLGSSPTGEALRYYTADGAGLADLTVSGGTVTATAVTPDKGGVVTPNLSPWQIACFAVCVGRKSGAQCIITCEHCFYYAVGTLARIIACSNCLVCAGPNGVPCLKECSII